MGWCDFPVDCGNFIEVSDSTGPSAPPPPDPPVEPLGEYIHTHTYTLFMLEIYRVAVELMYSRK